MGEVHWRSGQHLRVTAEGESFLIWFRFYALLSYVQFCRAAVFTLHFDPRLWSLIFSDQLSDMNRTEKNGRGVAPSQNLTTWSLHLEKPQRKNWKTWSFHCKTMTMKKINSIKTIKSLCCFSIKNESYRIPRQGVSHWGIWLYGFTEIRSFMLTFWSYFLHLMPV